jgi:hypothetical protein
MQFFPARCGKSGSRRYKQQFWHSERASSAWRYLKPSFVANDQSATPVLTRLQFSARRPKLIVVAELRKRLVVSCRLEQRQEPSHDGINRPGRVPHVEIDRIQ